MRRTVHAIFPQVAIFLILAAIALLTVALRKAEQSKMLLRGARWLQVRLLVCAAAASALGATQSCHAFHVYRCMQRGLLLMSVLACSS